MLTPNEIVVQNLQPPKVWQFFAQLSNLPRLSGQEQLVRNWLIAFAKQKNLAYKQDVYGNLVIYKPAQHSSSLKTVCLQAHMDMVPAKESTSNHDFTKDPIQLVLQDDWLTANQTTLGADNGIGLSIILAILDDLEIAHPKLQALFTVEEESGLGGVNHLDATLLNPDYIINTDYDVPNQEVGVVCVGSAGGRSLESIITFPTTELQASEVVYQLDLSGLPGGHSGVDIHKNLPNASQLLASLLLDLAVDTKFKLVFWQSGSADNAIPAAGQVKLATTDLEVESKLEKILLKYLEIYRSGYPSLTITCKKLDVFPETGFLALDFVNTIKVLRLITVIPSGVIAMSQEVSGLVQTSNNLGIVETQVDNKTFNLRLVMMARSDNNWELQATVLRLINLLCLFSGVHLAVATDLEQAQTLSWDNLLIKLSDRVEGWQANPNSRLAKLWQEVFTSQTNKPVIVEAVHAGLECGKLASFFPNAEVISVGPEVKHLHSTNEKVRVSSVAEFYSVLVSLLSKI